MRYIAFLAAIVAALTLSPPAAAATDWAWPVRGDVVTPYKNGDDPYASGQHRGIDIAAPVATRVGAAVGGRVTFVGVAGSSGLTVGVRTGDGRYDVSYLHLSSAAVREGDEVGRGDAIGAVGSSGRRSVEQSHLHFGVRDAGSAHGYHDPLDFLPAPTPPARDTPPPAPSAAREPATAPPAAAPAAVAPAPAAAPSPDALPALGQVPQLVGAAADGLVGPQPSVVLPPHPAGSPTAGRPRGDGAARPAARVTKADIAGVAVRPARRVAHAAGRDRASDDPRPLERRPHVGSTRDDDAVEAGPRRLATDGRERLTVPDRRSAASPDGGGLNLGWIAAVAGLVAAATCLGQPQAARRAARSGRAAVGALLRPLAGRG